MPRTTRVVTGLGAAALAMSLAACSSGGGADTPAASGSSPATSSAASTVAADTSSPAATTDYASLLIDASDIPVPGFEKGTPQSVPQGNGSAVAFTGEGGRTLGVTVLVAPSPAAAQAATASSVDAAKAGVTDAEVTEAPIGDGGTAIRGTTGANAVAVLVFSEGRAVVVLEFDSPASDPVPTEVIQQVATAQDTKITSAPPQ